MKLKPTLLVLAVTSLMAGCDNNNTSKHAPNNNADNPPVALDAKKVEPSNSETPEQAAIDLKQLFSNNFEQSLSFNPIQATAIGDARFNDQLPNFFSEKYRKESHDFTV